jgi:hypothetical protein
MGDDAGFPELASPALTGSELAGRSVGDAGAAGTAAKIAADGRGGSVSGFAPTER